MHIVADENMPALDDFERLGRVTRVDGRSLTRADLRDADILLVRSVAPVPSPFLSFPPVLALLPLLRFPPPQSFSLSIWRHHPINQYGQPGDAW